MLEKLPNQIEYPVVEQAIRNILFQNQRPTVDKIRHELKINGTESDQILEYYLYMWEQRHTITYLDNIESINIDKLNTKEIAKRGWYLMM